MIDRATSLQLGISSVLVALVAGCSTEPSSSSDASAGAGGSTTGGQTGSGGAVSGGAPVGGRTASAGQGGGAGGDGAASDGGGSGGTTSAGAGGSAGIGGSGAAGSDGGIGDDSGPGTSDGGGAPPDCEGGKVVHFVYFVEADRPFSEAQRADVERQAFRFQQYWFDQLGVTFYVSHPVVDVIEGDHPADWYLNTPDGIHSDPRWYRLGNMKNEVYAKLGIRNFDPSHRVVSYPTTRYDGHVGGNFGGAWMDGDDLTCLADNGFNYPYPDNNSAHCTGHVAHEFGHVLGLDHQGPQDDCMQFGFYTNDPNDLCSFSPANVAQILADSDNAGWFEALPGETCTGP